MTCLGPTVGQEPNKLGAVCGKRLTFLYTNPYEHVKYNVSLLSTFVFKKCSEKVHPLINIVISMRLYKTFDGMRPRTALEILA